MATMLPETKPPYQHQIDYWEHNKDPLYGLFWEMGAGKTRAVLQNVEQLYFEDEVDLLIVIAPNGVHPNWPKRQAPLWLTVDYDYLVWNKKSSSKAFTIEAERVAASTKLKIAVFNVEAFSQRNGRAYKLVLSLIKRCAHRAFLVIDESTMIKNPKANRSKEIAKISSLCGYVRILTGTPSTESPFDLWMQFEAMQKGFWGRNFFLFKQHFAEWRTVRFGARAFDEVVEYRHLDELRAKIAPHRSEVIKSECMDLPPKVYTVVEVELTAEQRKAYKEMLDYYVTKVGETEVLTDTPLARLQKLHQITTGHIIDEDGVTHKIPHNRLAALTTTIESLTCKTIIFCQYVAPIKEIMEELGEDAVEFSGRINDDGREEAITRFQHDPLCRHIVISLQSAGAYGLDLFAAGAVIYYCNGYSLERRMQSEDRAHRPGQEHDCVAYIDIICPGTVDENVQQALTDKIDVASKVTRLMTSWIR